MRAIVSRFPFFNRFLLLAFFAAVSSPGARALPSEANLKLDPTCGLAPRPAGHAYFSSPTDWWDVNICQLFTDRLADGDSTNNTTGAMGINRSICFESGKSFPQNRNFHHGGDWKGLKINLTHICAAWDDNNLYLAWQFVDVTDKIDGSIASGAGSGRIGSNHGILPWIALDIKAGQGASKDRWSKNKDKQGVVQPLWNGASKPDFQIYPADSLWGVAEADDRRAAGAPSRNFVSEGHDPARDSFYEIKIPLALLGLSKAQLESQGIGVMIGAGSKFCADVLPRADGATLDAQGVETWNSSLEWGDVHSITAPCARIAAW